MEQARSSLIDNVESFVDDDDDDDDDDNDYVNKARKIAFRSTMYANVLNANTTRVIKSKIEKKNNLTVTILSLFLVIMLVFSSIYLFVRYVIVARHLDRNNEKPFDSFENPYLSKVAEVIPSIQNWYQEFNNDQNPLLVQSKVRPVPYDESNCVNKFLKLGLDLGNFDEYDTFFKDDSTMVVAQAGTYRGPENIAEYASFASSRSPYVDSVMNTNRELHFKGFDYDSGQCEFLIFRTRRYKGSQMTKDSENMVEVNVMYNIFFHLQKDYVKKIHVFFPEGYLNFFFNNFDMTVTGKYICSTVMADVCNFDVKECTKKLSELPITEKPHENFDGKSQGCRILHAVFAEMNPNTHCAHLSFTPLKDPNGKLKCQNSMALDPTEFFKKSYINAFHDWQLTIGMDPIKGFRVLDGSTVQSDSSSINTNQNSKLTAVHNESNEMCIESLFHHLMENIPTTSPTLIELVVQNLGLVNKVLVRESLEDLLTSPQSLLPQYNKLSGCLSSIVEVSNIACLVQKEDQFDLSRRTERHIVEYLVNQAIVYETITQTALNEPALMNEIVDTMINERRLAKEDAILDHFSGDEADNLIDSYHSASMSLQLFAKNIAEDSDFENQSMLQMHILDQVKRDIDRKYDSNARVGLALAAAIQYRSNAEDNIHKWRLGRSWTSAYLAWSVAAVWGSQPADGLSALFLPSLSCAAEKGGDTFVSMRVVSASLSLMHIFDAPLSFAAFDEEDSLEDTGNFYEDQVADNLTDNRFSLASRFGESNIESSKISNPSKERVEKMLFHLCGKQCHESYWEATDKAPQAFMTSEQWSVYMGLIIWITCILAGFGLELLVYTQYFTSSKWTMTYEKQWLFAQFFFPVMASTFLGLATQHNYLCIPIMIVGLWKFGFPETILYQHLALFEAHASSIRRISNFLNGTGTILHHSAASLLVCMILPGVVKPTREVLDAPLILVTQHWFVLLKYVNKPAYIIVQLLLEIWFEWTVISNFEYYILEHWTVYLCAAVMLVAHWEYILSAGLSLIRDVPKTDY